MGIIIPDLQQPVWAEQWLVCKVVAHLCANLLEITTRVFCFFKITLHNSAVLVMFEWNVFVNRVCVCLFREDWNTLLAFLLRLEFTGWCFFFPGFYRRVIGLLRSVFVLVKVRMRIRGTHYVNEGHRKYWGIVCKSWCQKSQMKRMISAFKASVCTASRKMIDTVPY